MIDELEGNIIKEGYFFGIKQYGYHVANELKTQSLPKMIALKSKSYLPSEWYTYKDSSLFASVERNAITFDEIESISNGETINKYIPNRFYKSFKDLSITIKSTKIFNKNG
uniref:DNA polymerase 2 n=1 Tax=Tricholoma saponaceum TaxID=113602 RepID=A0A6C0W4R1_9AGAR|nr:DNA polymerase 2 [Tricholoma saponaceum]QIC20303.1 DNA polymerase 2 [Tricholoma saponaceum]